MKQTLDFYYTPLIQLKRKLILSIKNMFALPVGLKNKCQIIHTALSVVEYLCKFQQLCLLTYRNNIFDSIVV